MSQTLKEFDSDARWRKLNSMSPKVTRDGLPENNYRYVKQELILRFFAFIDRENSYKGQIAKFLNDYMHDNRNPSADFITQKTVLFQNVVFEATRIFPNGPETKLPTAVIESMLVGLARNIEKVKSLSDDDIKLRFHEFRASDPFSGEGLSEGLSKSLTHNHLL